MFGVINYSLFNLLIPNELKLLLETSFYKLKINKKEKPEGDAEECWVIYEYEANRNKSNEKYTWIYEKFVYYEILL